MYNPREGKLRRNKYFNLGYENTSGWEARKALADCITAYVDMGDPPHVDNSERAIAALRQFTRGTHSWQRRNSRAARSFRSSTPLSNLTGAKLLRPPRC